MPSNQHPKHGSGDLTWQCTKKSRDTGSLVRVVLGLRHIWHVTYSTMYFRRSDSMYLGTYLPGEDSRSCAEIKGDGRNSGSSSKSSSHHVIHGPHTTSGLLSLRIRNRVIIKHPSVQHHHPTS